MRGTASPSAACSPWPHADNNRVISPRGGVPMVGPLQGLQQYTPHRALYLFVAITLSPRHFRVRRWRGYAGCILWSGNIGDLEWRRQSQRAIANGDRTAPNGQDV